MPPTIAAPRAPKPPYTHYQAASANQRPWVDVRIETGCCRTATDTAFRQAGITPRRAVQADDYWPAQGFVAAGLGNALIPSLALNVLHDNVMVRRLEPDTQPIRHILAVTRPAVARMTPVQAIITALQTTADGRRNARQDTR